MSSEASEFPDSPELNTPETESSASSPSVIKDAVKDPGLIKTLAGSAIAGSIGYFAYQLMWVMISRFPPISTRASQLAQSLSILVRYFVVGTIALMAFMFGAVAVGLLAYSGQVLVQKWVKPQQS